MRLVCITGTNYVVYEGRQVVARLVDTENHGIYAVDVEAARVADYPPIETKEIA